MLKINKIALVSKNFAIWILIAHNSRPGRYLSNRIVYIYSSPVAAFSQIHPFHIAGLSSIAPGIFIKVFDNQCFIKPLSGLSNLRLLIRGLKQGNRLMMFDVMA